MLILGDSLSAGYGLDNGSGWVSLLQRRLEKRGSPDQVLNASISGETTSGALARLPQLLAQHRPRVVVIELGGNDGLRGLSLGAMADNLRRLVRLSRDAGARVLLVGMRLPPNYGPLYTGKFAAVYADLARAENVALLPFLLQGVAGQAALMQADGMHADAQAQPRLLENVWPVLEPLLH